MKWLLWKEYRLQRLILAVGLFLLFVPYAASLLMVPLLMLSNDAAATSRAIGFAAFVSTILSVATLALLGGNAIASERADRSAEFQAYQPISRWVILASKLVFPVLAAIVLWGVNLYFYERHTPQHLQTNLEWIYLFYFFGFHAFCVAWLGSALQSSPTFAVGAGVAAPTATLWILSLVAWLADGMGGISERSLTDTWATLNVALGLLSFVVGSWYYLRRVEP